MSYTQTSLEEIIIAAQAVLKRFPDAVERVNLDHPNQSFYYSKLLSKNLELKQEYSGTWYNLTVHFHVEVPFIFNGSEKTITVLNDPSWYKIVRFSYDNSICKWGNSEKLMLEHGFTETHIKDIHKHFIKLFLEDRNSDIKLEKDNLPEHVKKMLLFL